MTEEFFPFEINKENLAKLIENRTPELSEKLFVEAQKIRKTHYGNKIYLRGLIEISSYCKNDCLYCGIRKSNVQAERYRLTPEQILDCCCEGYEWGFRTFVLQGGEDFFFTDEMLVQLIQNIKRNCPGAAVTLSLGEKTYEQYKSYFTAGADRYLLRHETANTAHYQKLHPAQMSHAQRLNCLRDLKRIGYQVGTGFMVGSPYQTPENLAEDLLLLLDLQPQMVGIGPFIPHHATPFAQQNAGSVELTLFMLALIRILLPKVLLPSTTALGTLGHSSARKNGILAGANVIMPNLSPKDVRAKYMIYDEKNTSHETLEFIDELKNEMSEIGYQVSMERGDAVK